MLSGGTCGDSEAVIKEFKLLNAVLSPLVFQMCGSVCLV